MIIPGLSIKKEGMSFTDYMLIGGLICIFIGGSGCHDSVLCHCLECDLTYVYVACSMRPWRGPHPSFLRLLSVSTII